MSVIEMLNSIPLKSFNWDVPSSKSTTGEGPPDCLPDLRSEKVLRDDLDVMLLG